MASMTTMSQRLRTCCEGVRALLFRLDILGVDVPMVLDGVHPIEIHSVGPCYMSHRGCSSLHGDLDRGFVVLAYHEIHR